MKLALTADLPYVTVTVAYRGAEIEVPDVLVDTGSASTMFASDVVAAAGISPRADDELRVLRGVGGTEVVFARQVDRVRAGSGSIEQFVIEVGGMDYGFEINGILGMDYLRGTGAIINLADLTLDFSGGERGR